MPPTLSSARRNYNLSALIARRAVQEARRGGAVQAIITHQFANARTSQAAVVEMLAEQNINAPADAALNLAGFTTDAAVIRDALEQVEFDWQFERLVGSLVQDAGRAAESVSVASRPQIGHVRAINPPCCSRCAILAGRFYRWSDGFKRHPGCDCTMIPTTVASPLRQSPEQLVRDGLVTGLSKADMSALNDGADLGRLVNVRSTKAGLSEAGQTLRRGNRLTPAGIYRQAGDDHAKALTLLQRNGYIR